MPGFAELLKRRQITIYVAALGLGAVAGSATPDLGPGLEHTINPLLGALLYVTFLQVPAADLIRSSRSGRFLTAAMTVNFVTVPLVVAAMFPLLPGDRALQVGFLLVMLAPCVDYVIVFCALAGGSSDKLLAATPLLLLAQMLALPALLYVFLGPDLADVVEAEPFLKAFLLLILIPLLLAWSTQAWASRHPWGRVVSGCSGTGMVPLMAATLLIVVASQVPTLDGNVGGVARVVPLYVAFLVVMAGVGLGVARAFHLNAPAARAVVFTGATRNSLVVLPLALALPDEFAIAAVVIVTQTLVEILGMIIYVHLIPQLVKA